MLTWFYDWIHPLAEEIPAGSEPGEDAVLDALRALQSILTKEGGAAAVDADRTVLVDAVSTLGNYPWSKLSVPDPRLVRTKVAQPRGVVRTLAGRPLNDARSNALLADTLDRALIRVTDQVITMSLLGALVDPSDHVRAAAARAAADRRVPGGAALIGRALPAERESSVRMACVVALGTLGTGDETAKAEAIPALAATLGDSNDSVRRAAATELARLTGEDPGPTWPIGSAGGERSHPHPKTRRRGVKRAIALSLRLLGVALVGFVLWRIQYRDLLDPEGAKVVGQVKISGGTATFVGTDGTVSPLPSDWAHSDRLRLGSSRSSCCRRSGCCCSVCSPSARSRSFIYRWYYLLRAVGVPATYWESVRLSYIGFFFNSAVPGLTGGDLVKAFYIARQSPGSGSSPS